MAKAAATMAKPKAKAKAKVKAKVRAKVSPAKKAMAELATGTVPEEEAIWIAPKKAPVSSSTFPSANAKP